MKPYWLMCVMALGAAPLVLAQAPDIPNSVFPEQSSPQETTQESAEAEPPGPVQWWNSEELAGRLQLTEAQRKEMDQLWDTHQKAREATDKARRSLTERLSRAFADGDLEAARALTGKLETSLPSTENHRVKLQILSTLDATQLQTLRDAYPAVLEKPWRRNTQRLLAGEGKTRGARRNRKPQAESAEAKEEKRKSRKAQED